MQIYLQKRLYSTIRLGVLSSVMLRKVVPDKVQEIKSWTVKELEEITTYVKKAEEASVKLVSVMIEEND